MKNNLSYLLSTIEFAAKVEAENKTLDNCESEILKQQPKWQRYLEQQANLLQEAIQVFKEYDKAGELKYFWQMLKTKNADFNEGIGISWADGGQFRRVIQGTFHEIDAVQRFEAVCMKFAERNARVRQNVG